MHKDLSHILFEEPGVLSRIAIGYAFEIAMFEAVFKRDPKAAKLAVERMLIDCKRAGVDPIECLRVTKAR